MKVIRYGQKIKTKETTLILGGFGFIHNGHLKIIEKAKSLKKPISMMIIENPQFFKGEKEVQPLTDRLQDLANIGISIAIVIKMDKSIASSNGKEFLDKIKKSVNAKITVSGSDFALGKNRSLKAKDIKDNLIVDFFKVNNTKISSSILIDDIIIGNVKDIKKFTPFGYTTTVEVNTKNIINNSHIIEKHAGIYAIWGEVNDILYWGYTHVNIGGEEYIKLPQLKIKNKRFKVRIHYANNIRKIFKSSNDQINEKDKEDVLKYLSN